MPRLLYEAQRFLRLSSIGHNLRLHCITPHTAGIEVGRTLGLCWGRQKSVRIAVSLGHYRVGGCLIPWAAMNDSVTKRQVRLSPL